jgi:hypothetical protein
MSDYPAFNSMTKYIGAAIDNREAIYQADREAVADLLREKPRASLLDKTAAKQRARGAAQVKELVANNRWNMMQAVMFGVASLARTAIGIHHEVRRIRELLEQK